MPGLTGIKIHDPGHAARVPGMHRTGGFQDNISGSVSAAKENTARNRLQRPFGQLGRKKGSVRFEIDTGAAVAEVFKRQVMGDHDAGVLQQVQGVAMDPFHVRLR
jgi:hypothetical protein